MDFGVANRSGRRGLSDSAEPGPGGAEGILYVSVETLATQVQQDDGRQSLDANGGFGRSKKDVGELFRCEGQVEGSVGGHCLLVLNECCWLRTYLLVGLFFEFMHKTVCVYTD
ncbi:hypothetical protein Salat_1902600 [Sesamum alatum]|uniref:Uncharacterized protein n=1 Tax=Sesamum alatum TaxID=300844 RepID=A0AAE2CI96_9LAMI|nr:hypothetical protein Salat_1902600 [Sesamum alatum]